VRQWIGDERTIMSFNQRDLMRQVEQMQHRMAQAQEEIAAATVEGSAGGGVVTVMMTGDQEMRAVTIKPEAVDPDDVETLQDLVLAAVNDALQRSKELQQERLSEVTGGLGLPPGLGF
jgi:DNA-binding YbaB/EbfC family protein